MTVSCYKIVVDNINFLIKEIKENSKLRKKVKIESIIKILQISQKFQSSEIRTA